MADPAAVQPPDHGGLLVVDDEPFLRDAVAASLRFLGFAVTTAQTGADALRLARDRPFDLVVLDVMLPDTDGFDVVRRLRRDGCRVPVIFLTARDTQADKVTGLTLGGDDYLTKPFGLEELAARIRTVLRRTRPAASGPVLTFADIELDQDSYEVRRGGHLVDLSPTEFRLLRYLMLNPGRVLTRAQILDHVWDYDFGGSSTVVSTYVAYLRRKLAGYGPDVIHTQRGVGYSLRLPRPGEQASPTTLSPGPDDAQTAPPAPAADPGPGRRAAVTVVALAAFDVAAVTALRRYLLGQTDSRLQNVLRLYRPVDRPASVQATSASARRWRPPAPAHTAVPGPASAAAWVIAGPRLRLSPPVLDQYYVGYITIHGRRGFIAATPTWFRSCRPAAGLRADPHVQTVASDNGPLSSGCGS